MGAISLDRRNTALQLCNIFNTNKILKFDKTAKSTTYYYVYLIQAINPSLYCTVYYYKPLGNGCCTINAFLDSSNLAALTHVTTWVMDFC